MRFTKKRMELVYVIRHVDSFVSKDPCRPLLTRVASAVALATCNQGFPRHVYLTVITYIYILVICRNLF